MEERNRIEVLIETERSQLLKTLRFYALRAGLASSRNSDAVAEDLLNETVFEAFRTANRLKPEVNPHPWLLGIALNLIKRKQAEIAKRERREPLVRDLLPDTEAILSDDDLFDQLPNLAADTLDSVDARDEIEALLRCISPGDSEILRMALAYDMNGEALAKVFHITPGAARVRLHRALNRLRQVLIKQKEIGDA